MSEDLSHRIRDLTQAVENVLVASHGPFNDLLQHHLKSGTPMPVFEFNSGELSEEDKRSSALVTAAAHYGPTSPMLRLWVMCRALTQLRTVWTGAIPKIHQETQP